MLVLSRKLNERILIGDGITIRVLRLTGATAKLGIEAPPHVQVHRQEVYEAIQKNNREAITDAKQAVPPPLKQWAPPRPRARVSSVHTLKHTNQTQYPVESKDYGH